MALANKRTAKFVIIVRRDRPEYLSLRNMDNGDQKDMTIDGILVELQGN